VSNAIEYFTAYLTSVQIRVPTENLVGTEGGAVMCMMRNLEIERIVLAAMSLGIARRCIYRRLLVHNQLQPSGASK
jgi:alkylation response protein AidB-like acyl-CoA dehydrogenase